MLDLGGGILQLLVLLAQLVEQLVIDTDGQGDGVTIGQGAGGEVKAGVTIGQDVGEDGLRYHVLGVWCLA